MMTPGPAPDRQILDTAHLARQSLGDSELEREVLALFDEQCGRLFPVISRPGQPAARADAAHTLTGAARAVGAWRVAEAADALERPLRASGLSPASEGIAALEQAIIEVRQAIGDRCKASA
jgi:HPt (histidine-containing phosphotransfer) domain-containing protein